jgi:hypothetical protein
MKHTRFLFFLLLLLAGSVKMYAQNYDQATNGSLAIIMAAAPNTTINVNYTVVPADGNNMVFQINPSTGFDLNAHIVDANGAEVLPISTETVGARYAKTVDVSSLAAGSYYFEFFGPLYQAVYRIPFSKN